MRRLIDRIVRPLVVDRAADGGAAQLLDAEWLVTNGLGGYSSCSVAGVNTRRYHGILVAALPNPIGRVVLLNHLGERVVRADGTTCQLGGEEIVERRLDRGIADRLASFQLEGGLPVWRYAWDGIEIEKRLYMPHRQNTVYVRYLLSASSPAVRLELHPELHFRGYEAPVNQRIATRYAHSLSAGVHRFESGDPTLPPLRVMIHGAAADVPFVHDERITSELLYPVEEDRGYEFRGTLWAPGHFVVDLTPGVAVCVVASAEDEAVMAALAPDEAFRCEDERRRRLLDSAIATDPANAEPIAGELVLAADQFIFTPAGRVVDATRAAAMGDEIRSVIAGYHWFTDWGRDTMISLEGLTLSTGRHREAGFILRTFAHYVRDGLIPNMFPDGSNEGLYHTADATLWFFHALHRYTEITGERDTLYHTLPTLQAIFEAHLRGTHYGIHVDPADGLLVQGAEGYQLTWMDAKVDGWVVTPRRGKAVEINALWYNALRLLEGWLADAGDPGAAARVRDEAARVRQSFNERFWDPALGYLRDVVDGEGGDSTQCRPNQIFAISLDHAVLDEAYWAPVLGVVHERLLTPVGLRSLAPGDPDYKARYSGDLRSRDAAYHQGTVWAWLIGPFVDAYLKVHPGSAAAARQLLDGCLAALGQFGLGSIGEIFDAEAPYTPRGCIAQAWSVAEALRCWGRTAAPRSGGAAAGPSAVAAPAVAASATADGPAATR